MLSSFMLIRGTPEDYINICKEEKFKQAKTVQVSWSGYF